MQPDSTAQIRYNFPGCLIQPRQAQVQTLEHTRPATQQVSEFGLRAAITAWRHLAPGA